MLSCDLTAKATTNDVHLLVVEDGQVEPPYKGGHLVLSLTRTFEANSTLRTDQAARLAKANEDNLRHYDGQRGGHLGDVDEGVDPDVQREGVELH
ncbi:hypothetical protein TYRP_005212 [Tyrophagus putrescentiae]|nr:hypothetical protein TYRP_005212 [Tyrophagus putrescentiae]